MNYKSSSAFHSKQTLQCKKIVYFLKKRKEKKIVSQVQIQINFESYKYINLIFLPFNNESRGGPTFCTSPEDLRNLDVLDLKTGILQFLNFSLQDFKVREHLKSSFERLPDENWTPCFFLKSQSLLVRLEFRGSLVKIPKLNFQINAIFLLIFEFSASGFQSPTAPEIFL